MKSRSSIQRFLPAALVLLAVLTVALSLQQLKWLRQAADAETVGIRRQMALSAAEGIHEIRVVFERYFGILRNVGEEDDIPALTDAYFDGLGYSGLVEGILVMRRNDGVFWEAVYGDREPEALLGTVFFAEMRIAAGNFFELTKIVNRAFSRGVIIGLPQMESIGRHGVRDMRSLDQVIVVVTRIDDLINRVMVPTLTAALEGYDIRLTTDERELYDSGVSDPERRPELAFPLENIITFGLRPPEDEQSIEGRSWMPQTGDRSLIMFYRDILALDPSASESEGVPGHPRRGFFLDVFYPGTSLSRAVDIRTGVNIAISVGVLFLLFATALAFYRFSRRLAAQHAREQEFVASVSHELRTPITVIKAAAENLSEGVISTPERVTKYGREISDQSVRLERMVEGILLYSGLGSERKLRPVTVDLPGRIEKLASSFRSVAARSGAEFTYSFEGKPTVEMDPSALNLVVENLVMNALVHGASDGGWVSLRVDSGPFGRLRVIVEDSGKGIPKKEQRDVFEPFVRGTRSVETQRPGSGLGLHLVSRIVSMMQGTVMLESPYVKPDGTEVSGCRFTAEFRTGETDER